MWFARWTKKSRWSFPLEVVEGHVVAVCVVLAGDVPEPGARHVSARLRQGLEAAATGALAVDVEAVAILRAGPELRVLYLHLDGEVPPPARLRHPAEDGAQERVRVGALVVEGNAVTHPDGAAAVLRGRQRAGPEHDAFGGR